MKRCLLETSKRGGVRNYRTWRLFEHVLGHLMGLAIIQDVVEGRKYVVHGRN